MKKIGFLVLITVTCWVLPAGAKMMSIGKDNVNIRSGPSLQSQVLYQAPLGYPIQVLENKGKWARFTDWEGNSGWIYSPLLSKIHTVVVSAGNPNIRKGPGLRNSVVMRANRGDIFKVLAQKGNWVKVGYYYSGDAIGWIRNDLIWGE
ncbi:MAG: SH3 domain-containing protein [Desulfobacca sp.]|nr:SH3 domain-containing protein [Desulfobacca sp.]